MTFSRRQIIIALMLGLLSSAAARAQSGRRPPPAPDVTAPPASEVPTPAVPLGRRISLLIAREPSSKELPPTATTILSNFSRRLSEFDDVEVTWLGELKRKEAVKRARAESDAFLVLVRFEIDKYQPGVVVLNSPDLRVKYTVFAPVTGQNQLSGKVYYQAISGAHARRDNWPDGPPVRITPEAAGSEAAERLHEWLALVGSLQNK
jgi:hypothetical protein